MAWTVIIAYFLGGVFFANAIPHFVSGLMGRPFQSPFAKPPFEGLSSSTVNVLWGAFNLLVVYLLIYKVGDFNAHNTAHALTLGSGSLAASVLLARKMGRFYGGNSPTSN
ncbi:MAG: hypothetical protein IV090_09635 [Candidatus Sericytochromatia bacterium]|nr:hypothetical protein [Candidatus Sericytochromatia bacterium]